MLVAVCRSKRSVVHKRLQAFVDAAGKVAEKIQTVFCRRPVQYVLAFGFSAASLMLIFFHRSQVVKFSFSVNAD